MRTTFWLCATIVLFPTILCGYEPAANRFVNVQTPMVRLVPTEKHLLEWCGVDGRIEACTRFISFRLEATCAPAGEKWTMAAAATFRPWIFLRNMAQLGHEHEHIRDVERMAADHAAALESLSFGSAGDCRQRSIQEATAFGETMRQFARRSNELHHGR
jgi:hypothetical protein